MMRIIAALRAEEAGMHHATTDYMLNVSIAALRPALTTMALLSWLAVVDATATEAPAPLEPRSQNTNQRVQGTIPALAGELAPANAAAHHNLAVALYAKGEQAAAILEYKEALQLHPDFAEAHHGLGLALASQGDVEAAIAEYRATLALQPDYAMAHGSLGMALDANGDPDGAIREYREAIRLEPDLWMVQNNLGVALKNKGDSDGAIAAYQEAIRLKPNNPVPHNNLGISLQAKGDLEGSITAYRTALRLQSGPLAPDTDSTLAMRSWQRETQLRPSRYITWQSDSSRTMPQRICDLRSPCRPRTICQAPSCRTVRRFA